VSARGLRILFALQYYLPHRTGLTLHVQRVAESLARRGHQVTVVCARHDPRTPRDEQVVNGVRVVRLWAPLRVTRGAVMPAYAWAAWSLVAGHDVVSIHTPMAESAVYALYTKLLRRGLVITHHGDLTLPRGAFNRLVETVTFQVYRAAAARAQRLIAYSDDYAGHSRWIRPYLAKTRAIAPPIEIPEPDPERVRALRAAWLGADVPRPCEGGSAALIGFAGRFVEEKRPDLLLEALGPVARALPASKAVFAGQYDIRYERCFERHAALVESRRAALHFLGLLEDPAELANFYAACDVLALPSASECFGLVQVEAMRCGTPVVVSDIPGARVPVQRTGMGLTFPTGDAAALAAALVEVARHRPRYQRTLAQVEQHFSLAETVSGYERELAGAARAARGAEAGPQ
jgi:glycosyltransferase involved in cell wall biosynthesis